MTANVDSLRGFSEWYKTKLRIKTQVKKYKKLIKLNQVPKIIAKNVLSFRLFILKNYEHKMDFY